MRDKPIPDSDENYHEQILMEQERDERAKTNVSQIRIGASMSGSIPTGRPYEQMKPFVYVEEILIPNGAPMPDQERLARQRILQAQCEELFGEQVQRIRLAETREKLARLNPIEHEGRLYIRVTSVFQKQFDMPAEKLIQYAA